MPTIVDPFASIDNPTVSNGGTSTPKAKPTLYDPFATVAPAVESQPRPDELSSNIIKDTGIKLAQGAIDLGDSAVGVGDLLSGGNLTPALQSIGYDPDRAKAILGQGFSGKQKYADQQVAEAEGFADKAMTAIENPRSIWGTVSQSVPLMLGGMGSVGLRGTQIASKAAAPLGGLSTTAGKQAAQAAKERAKGELILTGAATEGAMSAGMTAAEAERAGREYEDYLMPALGSAAATTALGGIGGRVFGDSPTQIMAGVGGVKGGVLGRATQAGKSALIEGGEETLQEAAQTVFNNMALGNEPLEGVEEAAAMGLLAGGVMGGGLGLLQKPMDAYDAVLDKGRQDMAGGQAPAQDVPADPGITPADISTDDPMAEMPEIDITEPANEASTETDLVFTSKGTPFASESTAKRAATNKTKLRGEQFDVVAVDGGFALKPKTRGQEDTELVRIADEFNAKFPGEGTRALQTAQDENMSRRETIRHLNTRFDELSKQHSEQATHAESDRINTLRKQMNDIESGSGDAAIREAIDTGDMNEAQTYSYLQSRQKKLQQSALEATIGKRIDTPAKVEKANEQQTQTQAEQENPPETAGTQTEPVVQDNPKLSRDIAKAAPRYSYGDKKFTLKFDSDIDRAAYIAAQARPSKRDADYVKFVTDNADMTEEEVRAYGAKVRDHIKSQAKEADPGELSIGYQGGKGNVSAPINQESETVTADAVTPETAPVIIDDAITNQEANAPDNDSTPLPPANIKTPDSAAESLPKVDVDIDAAANESAESPLNDLSEPSEAQKEAGNYKMGHAKVAGLDVTIENPKGSKRKGTDKDGNQWENQINHHYGYIRGSIGKDKDHVDVFLGDDADTTDRAYVIDQVFPDTGKFDEHKVMLGFDSVDAAKAAYLSNYDKGWKGVGGITDMPLADFKEWVKDPKKTSRPAAAVVSGNTASKIEAEPADNGAADTPAPTKEDVTKAFTALSGKKGNGQARQAATRVRLGMLTNQRFDDLIAVERNADPDGAKAFEAALKQVMTGNDKKSEQDNKADKPTPQPNTSSTKPKAKPVDPRLALLRSLKDGMNALADRADKAGDLALAADLRAAYATVKPVNSDVIYRELSQKTIDNVLGSNEPLVVKAERLAAKRVDQSPSKKAADSQLSGEARQKRMELAKRNDLMGETSPESIKSLNDLLESPDTVKLSGALSDGTDSSGESRPDWKPAGNGFVARSYVWNGVATQEVKSPSGAIARRKLRDGIPSADLEATATFENFMSGAAFSEFESFFSKAPMLERSTNGQESKPVTNQQDNPESAAQKTSGSAISQEQPRTRDKFSKELERKGVATDGNGDTYRVIQSETDPEAYLIEKIDSDGNRTTHGSPNEKWDMGYTREKIMQRAWFEDDAKTAQEIEDYQSRVDLTKTYAENEGVEVVSSTSPFNSYVVDGKKFSGSEILPEYPKSYDAKVADSLEPRTLDVIQDHARARSKWYAESYPKEHKFIEPDLSARTTNESVDAEQAVTQKESKSDQGDTKPDGLPVEDDRQRVKLNQARQAGRDAYKNGDERTPPEWMSGDLADAWLAGYGDGIAKNVKADTGTAKPAKEESAEFAQAKADMDKALGDLGEIFLSANLFSKNAVPTELNAADLMPVLTRIMDAAFRMGYAQFKQNSRFVLDTVRARFGDAAADSLGIDELQGAYIAMKKGSDTKLAVISVESVAEIMADTDAETSQPVSNTDNIETPVPVEELSDDAGRNETSNTGALENIPSTASEELEAAGLPERSPSSGSVDANGNERTNQDRAGRADSVDGNPQPVLHSAAADTEQLANSPAGRNSDRPNKVSGENPGNFVITDDLDIGGGTTLQKLNRNLAAITTLKDIERDNRFATPEEQAILAQYSGWGGLKQAFDIKNADATGMFGKAYRQLKETLTEEEYSAAFATVKNAHYTAKGVVDAMWRAARHFGFAGGRVLEPTVGTGNFIGMQPEDMAASSDWHAAELDSLTGRIAKHVYPESKVLDGTGFENAMFADGVFDLAIGNPPFGSETIKTKRKALQDISGMKIHNFIIAKTGKHLRPGGVMAMVVTHRFMDTANPEARNVLAKDFKLMGAVRLPNDAFQANANTEVTTDIVFLQKLHPDEKRDYDAAWLNVNGKIDVDGNAIKVNKYFEKNPTHILGRSAMDGSLYRGNGEEYTVHSDGRDLGAAIDDIINNDWSDLAGTLKPQAGDVDATAVMLQQSDLPVGGMVLNAEGKILRRDLDDNAGNAIVEEITADTLWKDSAAQWEGAYSEIDSLRHKYRGNFKANVKPDDVDSLIENTKFAYLATGQKKSKPTKAEQAIYDVVDAAVNAGTVPDINQALADIEKTLANKKLGDNDYSRLRGLLDLRNKTLALIHAEYQNDKGMGKLRVALNKAYDAFVAEHGFISDKKNLNVLAGDIGTETGLEKSYQPAVSAKDAREMGSKPAPAKAEKADILNERVNFPHKEITSAATPHDALHIALSERGQVDLPYMAGLLNSTTESVIRALSTGDNPEIFFDPETESYEHADSYLSGNVRHKLQMARENRLDTNITALEEVQPAPVNKEQVTPAIRGQWIPKEIFQQFLGDLGMKTGKLSIIESMGMISVSNYAGQPSDLGLQFADEDKTIEEIFNAAASGKSLNVYRTDASKKRIKDDPASQRVNTLVTRMAKVFSEWAYSDEQRTQIIVDAYNEKMNTHRSREWNGVKYLKTVGAVPENIIRLRTTQKNAAWRMITTNATLLDHVVGAGKTFTVVTGVMQRRRLGLSKKPMVAVPNHLVVQWAVDFYRLYPGAKILAATPDDFAMKNRRRLFARIATGDYDAIIIGHSSLGSIKAPDDDQKLVISEEVNLLKNAMEEARTAGTSKRTLTQLQNRLDKLTAKLQGLSERKADEIGIDFATMGVDYLAVDEAHEFKNLAYSTAGERVVGMNDPSGSQSAFHLYTLVRGLQRRDGGVAFATGTPVSNSLVELYTVMKYLASNELEQRNQLHFDAWSGTYTQTETRLEYTATQKLKPRRVLSGLTNLESLRQLYEQFADMITMADLKRVYAEEVAERNRVNGTNERTEFPVPKVKGGGRQLDTGSITPSQKEFMDYLVARMQVIESKGGDKEYPKIDNALNVLTDARKMSLDIRTVDPQAPRDENGKVMRAARSIKRIYDAWDADKGTQMVFSDMSTPAKQAGEDAKKQVADAMKKVHGDKAGKTKAKAIEDLPFSEQWVRVRSDLEEKLERDGLKDSERESLEKYVDELEDVDAVLLTADTGFSVYDDLRQVLADMDIPDHEVAFIHDYKTPEQKQKLFARVNNGLIRVLIGSTAKMGAGTNAQLRLVAEHHLDAPWRPSDVEQREGRIIRQGNMFYERDPDGFEVEIIAYSTEGTSDTVMWQILERKAGAIEQFRSGGLDKTQEEGADSDQYAEFMASSTGNPIFKLKLEAERRALELQSEIGGLQIARANARSFLASYEKLSAETLDRIESFSAIELGDARYGSFNGSQEELANAMADEQAAYDKAYSKFLDRRNEIEKLYDEAEAAGKSTNDLPRIPAKPPRPSLARKPVQDNSGYARAVAGFFREAVARENGEVAEMKVGGLRLEMRKSGAFSNDDTPRFTLFIVAGSHRVQIETGVMKDPMNSPNMLTAMMPDTLAAKVKETIKTDKHTIRRVEERMPQERDRADREIDTGAVEEANTLAEWYRYQVSLAEVAADRERAEKANKYIASDTRRPIKGFKDDTDKDRHDFMFNGQSYSGTGLSAKGGFAAGDFYDAVDESGRKAVVIAKKESAEEEGGKASMVVNDVMVEPEQARRELEAEQSAKETLSSKSLNRNDNGSGLNQRAALKILNKNKLLSRLIKSGKLKVQRSNENRQGAYAGGVATVYANNTNAVTVESTAWHEVTHAAMDTAGDTFINDKVKQKLFGQLQSQVDTAKQKPGNGLIDRAIARADYAKTPADQYLEEIAAYLVTEYIEQPKSFTGVVLNWVKDMIAAIKVAVMRHTGLVVGTVTAQDMRSIAKAYARKTATQTKINPRPNTRSLASVAMPSIEQMRKTVEQSDLKEELKRPFQRVWQGVKSNSFMFLTMRQMGDVTDKILPAIKRRYIPLKDKMEVEINRWRNRGGEISKERTKLKRDENMLLSEIQHDATLAGVDPAKPYFPRMSQDKIDARTKELHANVIGSDGKLSAKAFAEIKRMEEILAEEPARESAYDDLLPRFNALSANARRIYKSERDYHSDMNMKRKEILELRILGVSMNDATRRDLLNMLQERFESFEVAAPYFPLSRYGEFWVHAIDPHGEPTFNMFDTATQSEKFIAEIKKQGFNIIGSGKQLQNLDRIDGVSSEFIGEIDKLISTLGSHPAVDDIRKQVYDLYLQSLPDLSARKHFIRRKKTAGFHEDQSRAFADAVQHGSRDIAKLEFAQQLDDVVKDMRKTVEYAQSSREVERVKEQIDLYLTYLDTVSGQKSPTRHIKGLIKKAKKAKQTDRLEELSELLAIASTHSLKDVNRELESLYRARTSGERLRKVGNTEFAAYAVDEMQKTHDAVLNPNVHPVAQILNSFGFAWFLGLTPAAAFINTLQTPVISMPIVAAKHGVAKTSKLFGKASKDFFSRGNKQEGYSVENSKLTKDEHDAFSHFYDVGLLDNTLAHDTAGIAEGGVDNGSMRHKIMNAASYMFHRAEQFNREVTALAAYRATRSEGKTHEEAIQYASDIVYTSHFDYTAGNRARLLRGNVMRVVAQFKQYSQSMIYLYGRLGYQAFKGNGVEKAEARKAITGILAMQFALAGAAGLPLAGLFMGVAQLLADLSGDDDEPFLVEPEMRAAITKALSDLLGEPAGKTVSSALSNGLVNALTPLNLAGRISHSDMLIRMSDREIGGRDAAYDTMKAVGGVATSYIEMPFVAIEHLRNENYSKAVETMLPKFARDIVKAGRFAEEDARTARGYLLREMSIFEVAAQMTGFSSSRMSDLYGQNTARTNLENRLKTRRSDIIDHMVQSRAGDGDLAAARNEMEEWNKKHPEARITYDTIRKSEKGRIRYQDRMVGGRYTTDRYMDIAENYSWAY